MIDSNVFEGNFLRENGTGGAIAVEGGSIIITGSVNFTNNTAQKGGAIFFDQCKSKLYCWKCHFS